MAKNKADGFDVEAYVGRLRLMREIAGGESQSDFARRLGIPFKRWSNYERGYPLPRETAWLIWEKLGISIEWIWFGRTEGLTKEYQDKITAASKHDADLAAARKRVEEANKELSVIENKRKKAITAPSPRR